MINKTNDDTLDLTQFYKEGRPVRDYACIPSPSQVTKDLNVAHGNIRKLVGVNDRLHRQIHYLRIWNKVLTGAVVAAWGVILTAVGIALKFFL